MGTVYCKKCGVNRNYYSDNKLKTISFYSCRYHRYNDKNVCYDCNLKRCNCKHLWVNSFEDKFGLCN